MSRKDQRWILIVIVSVFLVIFIIPSLLSNIRISIEMKAYSIQGRIDSIKVLPRHIPLVYVDGYEYFLDNYETSNERFMVGDSIIKESGHREIYVFRKAKDSVVQIIMYSGAQLPPLGEE